MWQIHAQMALDLARERAEEARNNSLAAQARQHAALEARLHAPVLRPSRVRLALAAVLRATSGLFGSISDAACDAAARLDHRTA
jgi:hypothetical protein